MENCYIWVAMRSILVSTYFLLALWFIRRIWARVSSPAPHVSFAGSDSGEKVLDSVLWVVSVYVPSTGQWHAVGVARSRDEADAMNDRLQDYISGNCLRQARTRVACCTSGCRVKLWLISEICGMLLKDLRLK